MIVSTYNSLTSKFSFIAGAKGATTEGGGVVGSGPPQLLAYQFILLGVQSAESGSQTMRDGFQHVGPPLPTFRLLISPMAGAHRLLKLIILT